MSAQKIFFITGTDTDAGKTFVSCSILAAAKAQGLTTAAVKPVAAGVSETSRGLHNDDVIALAENCSLELALDEINGVCLNEAIAPHIAAARSGIKLDAKTIVEHCRKVIDKKADLTLVEGAGGWRVPLSHQETMADIARLLEVPVILVVGMRLGCLSHALLTAESIQSDGLELAGWIANRIDAQMPVYEENVATLVELMPAPMLAEIPWIAETDPVEKASRYIDMAKILSK